MVGQSIPIRIFLLGRFAAMCGERHLHAAAWTRRKAASLLQRLALERRLLRDQAIDFLWPEADLTSGANNLYRTIHALRQTVNSALGPGTADVLFAFEDGVLQLAESVWVDVHEFERLCSEAHTKAPEHRVAVLEQALATRMVRAADMSAMCSQRYTQGDTLWQPDTIFSARQLLVQRALILTP